MSRRETPSFYVFDEITTLNQNVSTISSQAKSIAVGGAPLSSFLQLQSTYNALSSQLSTVDAAISTNQLNYNAISSSYNKISSDLSLSGQVGYLSSVQNLYFSISTFPSSLNASQSLKVGTGTITAVGAIIGSNNTLTFNYGLATGQLNIVSAIGAVASGYGNNIVGAYSHADGSSSEIRGAYSHADGGTNSNYASYAHADGYRNTISSSADGGHTDGYGNFIMNNISSAHAEGYFTIAGGNYSHSEGTFTCSFGVASHAEGFGTRAQGDYSHADGFLTTAKGIASHTEGFSTLVEVGDYSHSEGQSNIINAAASHAEGFQTTVTAGASNGHAEGWATLISSANAHAEGRGSHARGGSSHVEGWSTIANGLLCHLEGSNHLAPDEGMHVEGFNNLTSAGAYSHTEGQACQTSSIASHAAGSNTKALGLASHSHGGGAVATGIAAHAHGFLSLSTVSAVGNYSHVHGSNVVASGLAATGVGSGTVQFASGNYSFVGGQFSRANGNNSFIFGAVNTNESPYTNMNMLGGQSNFTRLVGSAGVSSGTQTTVFPGIGATVLGGMYAQPRNNWSIVNAGGFLSNIQGTCQTEFFNLYCATSTTNTYCNFVYLSNKADEASPTTSNMCAYAENGRYFMNTFEVQVTGYERASPSTVGGSGIFSANYRFNCYWDNVSTISGGTRFRTWSLCDSDGVTVTNNQSKSLSSIITLNKLSGSPSIDVQAYVSTLTYSNTTNGQAATALSVKSSAGLPINWYAQVRQGITFMNFTGAF
jgi:hypothetical protein